MRYSIRSPRGGEESLVVAQIAEQPFAPEIVSFVEAISSRILKDRSLDRFPELKAMAFWMRKVNILKLKETFAVSSDNRTRLARGLVFHIAPSNVDTIFVYSWFLSMLMGNSNIVRISSEPGDQLEVLIDLINDICDESRFAGVRRRYLIIQYEHSEEITTHLSSLCDVRVIWGGDETIRRIRSIPLSPTAIELVFADKFSFALIDAEAFLSSDKQQAVWFCYCKLSN